MPTGNARTSFSKRLLIQYLMRTNVWILARVMCRNCQFLTRVSSKLRQAVYINHMGQNVISAGTDTAMMRISSGRPMRQ